MIDVPFDWPFVTSWFETPYRNSWANSFSEYIGEAIRLNQGSEMGLRQMPRQKPVRIRPLGEWDRTNRGRTIAV